MRKLALSTVLTLHFFSIQCTTTADVFRKYPNTYFIETGSYYGDGIQNALSAGFREVYSIELSPQLHNYCRNRFHSNNNVHLTLGDSGSALQQILSQIEKPATFWLDGHYSSGETAKGDVNTPIFQELEAIKNHKIKNHTILIDDVRLFGTAEFDFITLESVIKKLREININYIIHFDDGHVANDVLVAKPSYYLILP